MEKEIINRVTFRQLLICISLVTATLLPAFSLGQNFQWAKAITGQGADEGRTIKVDSSGNVYTTGRFQGTADFDPGTGVFNLTSEGNYDIFISKLSASGNLLWAKAMGGTGNEYGLSIIFDAVGNVYTTGSFQNTVDFDPGTGTFNLTSAGSDIYISKLDALGNFVWAKQMGGTNIDVSQSIDIDVLGNVYTTGWFEGTTDFDPGAGTYNLTSLGLGDFFISKLDAAGNFVWAKAMGGTGGDTGYSVALDGTGNVYTTGTFQGVVDFDPGAGLFNLTSTGNVDIFVSKLNAQGNFVWAKAMGGTSFELSLSLVLDGAGNVYTTGYFDGTSDFDPGSGVFNLTSAGSADIFVSKLDAVGNFVWARRWGGSFFDVGYSIVLDGAGNIYTTGYFYGTVDFDPGANVSNLSSVGTEDVFISKLDATGSFIYAGTMGGTGNERGRSIAIDGTGNIYTTGYFETQADFDPGSAVFNLSAVGLTDIFILKLSGTTLSVNEILPTDFNFSIYPNPSKELFNLILPIGSTEYKFTLTDILGSVICMDEIKVSTNAYQLNLANLSAGIYFITVENKEGKATRKIIKE